MPDKLITLNRAQAEVERLQKYIHLVENYETNTLNKWIIKQYALTNSIKKVLDVADKTGVTIDDGVPLDSKYITDVINGTVKDELHRILRLGYRKRIKPQKKKDYRYL